MLAYLEATGPAMTKNWKYYGRAGWVLLSSIEPAEEPAPTK